MTKEIPWKIESGIPLPVKRWHKYEWEGLKIDDSVVVGSMNAVRAGMQWAHRHDRKFETRKMREAPFGYRVWRTR